jgi:hypothetical protein
LTFLNVISWLTIIKEKDKAGKEGKTFTSNISRRGVIFRKEISLYSRKG